ncbi:hypothetical protein DPEC_G00342410 [Dallia pectoralis]|uniref:Uncharacterized protein n=1 Tax=Dallia pectoralis TaxID=75939 RepID=A0ACC2F5N4_DALPE|nr:hypothetical protein DPEC_G00342410 [Dallia pectoralis]
MANLTGYGPRKEFGSRWNRLCFDGDEKNYELWETKFLAHLRLLSLKSTILSEPPNDDGVEEDPEKNEDAYAELIQLLDDKSLSLVMRDAADDGRKALKILREHYAAAIVVGVVAAIDVDVAAAIDLDVAAAIDLDVAAAIDLDVAAAIEVGVAAAIEVGVAAAIEVGVAAAIDVGVAAAIEGDHLLISPRGDKGYVSEGQCGTLPGVAVPPPHGQTH